MNSAVEMPALDDEGYLVEPGEWSENIANELAHGLDIELGDKHWDVIRFTPCVRIVVASIESPPGR